MSRDVRTLRKRIFDIIEIGNKQDLISRSFDIFIVIMIFANLGATLASTFEELIPYMGLINVIEWITVVIFTIEYALRLWTAREMFPQLTGGRAVLKFVFSFYGLVDLLTFAPFYLPIFFPIGIVAFRILRIFRIFRLFKVNSQYDAFNVITRVISEKRNQLVSSVCLIAILMVSSSLGIYSFEHDAQPDIFRNAFSGIWWSVSTLLTVGYGDIYPITVMGRIFAIVTAFLGVGLVAIPTGIISAGFVEEYTKIKGGHKQMTSNSEMSINCSNCPYRNQEQSQK